MENPQSTGLSTVQILTSVLAFLVSAITAVLGWIVKRAGERLEHLEKAQQDLARETSEEIQALSERRAQSENNMRVVHDAALTELSKRTAALEIAVARSAVADENLTKAIDRLTGKVEKILENWPGNKEPRARY